MRSVARKRDTVKARAVRSDAPNWILGLDGPLYHELTSTSPDGGRIGRRWAHPTVNLCKGRKGSIGGVARVLMLGRFREVLFSPKGYGPTETQGKVRVCSQGPPGPASEASAEDNRERACRRARTMVRRLCLAYDLSYMWSMTFADDVTELAEAWKRWQRFVWRARRQGVLPGRWIAIPELQGARGVWHFHVATDRFVSYERVLACWNQGHISLTHPGASKGGSYIGKYISKTFETMDGEHRYRRSRGMSIPEGVDVEVPAGDRAWQDVLELAGPNLLGQAYLAEQGWWWLLGSGSLVGVDRPSVTWYRQDVRERPNETGGT